MKLYANVTSDRAYKGQGGNRYINIELMLGSAKYPVSFSKISFVLDGGDYILLLDGKEIKRQKAKKGDN